MDSFIGCFSFLLILVLVGLIGTAITGLLLNGAIWAINTGWYAELHYLSPFQSFMAFIVLVCVKALIS